MAITVSFKVAPDSCGKITSCFIKVRVILFFVQVLALTKSLLLVYQLNPTTRYLLTVGTGSHQWVPVIPFVKQVNIHVYSTEVKHLSLMTIIKHLHARVYWPFEGGVFLWIFFSYLCFMSVFVICYLVLSLRPCGRLLGVAGLLALLCVVLSLYRVFASKKNLDKPPK